VEVLLVVHRFPPDSVGGTELYALRLAQHLADRGDGVTVLTYAQGNTREAVLREHQYQGIPVWRLSFDLNQTGNPILEEYDNPRVAGFLREALSARRPDLLHIAHFGYLSTSVLAVAKEIGIPAVVTLTDLWPICVTSRLVRSNDSLCTGPTDLGECVRCCTQMGPRGAPYARLARLVPTSVWRLMAGACGLPLVRSLPYLRWLDALATRNQVIRQRLLGAKAIFCPGEFVRQVLVRNGYPAHRIRHSPHGIEELGRAHRDTPVGLAAKLRFGYVGPLARHKGAHLPVEAFASLGLDSQASLTYWGPVVGARASDSYGALVAERIAETKGANHEGPFPNETVGEIMARLDVLIVPSTWYENTPTVIYEALASGTPVVATDHGGMRELVNAYRGGWLFPRGDVRALASLMKRLVENRDLVRRAAAGIRRVPSFAAHFEEVALVYEQALSRESTP